MEWLGSLNLKSITWEKPQHFFNLGTSDCAQCSTLGEAQYSWKLDSVSVGPFWKLVYLFNQILMTFQSSISPLIFEPILFSSFGTPQFCFPPFTIECYLILVNFDVHASYARQFKYLYMTLEITFENFIRWKLQLQTKHWPHKFFTDLS